MAQRRIDPDAEFDPTAYVQNLLQDGSQPASEPCTAWTPPKPAPRRTRRPRGRTYGPDSIPGLVDYFTRAVPPLSWAGTLEIGNRQALSQVISELRHGAGLTPDDCRALIDLYVTQLNGRAPSRPYVWDFKWRRYQLLKSLRERGVTVTAADYESWNEPATSTADEDAAFIASWENS